MSSCAAPPVDHRHSAAAADHSNKSSNSAAEPHIEDDDDDEEYEEIEEEVEVEEEVEEVIEEEIEVEEEVEEEDDADDEIGEDLSPIPEDCKDVNQVVESEGREQQHGNIVANSLPDTSALGGCNGNTIISCPSEQRQKEEFNVGVEDSKTANLGKKINGFVGCELEECAEKKDSEFLPVNRNPNNQDDAHFSWKAQSDSDTTKLIGVSNEENSATISSRSGSVLYRGEETKQVVMHSGENGSQTALRLALPQIRPRSLSPGGEHNGENKRPTVVCAFFAKGWCIKGNSCGFLHIRDHADASSQHNDEDVAQKSNPADEGLRDSAENLGLPNYHKGRTFSIKYDTPSSSGGIQPWRSNEFQVLPLFDNKPSPIPSLKDVGTGSPREAWRDDYGSYASSKVKVLSPTYRDSAFRGTFSTRSTIMSDLGLKSSVPADGILPSKHILAGSGWPLPSKIMTWNAGPLSSRRLLDSHLEYSASKSATFLQSSSPFSGSESESLSQTNSYGDVPNSAKHKMNISSNDWEPSIPFQPTFFISQYLSNQYDPLHDSIEQPNSEYRFSRFSSIEGKLIHSRYVGNLGSLYSFDKPLLASCYSFEDRLLGKNSLDKDPCTTKTQTVGASSVEQQNMYTLSGEKKLLSPAQFADIKKTDSAVIDCSYRLKSDEQEKMTELEVDRARQGGEMVVDSKTDGNMNQESRELKRFRAALINFVKELVKPTWRGGHLSKDAHKIIVKRAVDKVLSTLQADQIPSTTEFIKQYLSSSEPKIAKLVEGYIEKYGKS